MPQRPTETILAARVARRFYVDDRSKTEIAEELGISRFRVARLIDHARESGMVQIRIVTPNALDTELSEELQRRYGLRHALVLDVPEEDPVTLRRALGALTSEVLQDIVTSDDVVGVAWARSLEGIADGLDRFATCTVVQLTGALAGPGGSDVLGVVRGLAKAGGGTPYVFYAPFIAHDAATARTLRRQADVSRALSLASAVTVAAVGIGAWAPGLSSIYDSLDPLERERSARAGVAVEVSGVLVDAAGKAVDTPLSRRIIGLTSEQLSSIETVLAVAYGDAKADAVRSALTGGWIKALVTHSSLARRLLMDRDTPT